MANGMKKLQNFANNGYDRQTGLPDIQETEEFICGNCRHLVDKNDKFCWQCGESLDKEEETEHYAMGKKLTNEQFENARKLTGKERITYIKGIKDGKQD